VNVGDDLSEDRPAALLCRSWSLEATTPPAPADPTAEGGEKTAAARRLARGLLYEVEVARLEAQFTGPLTPLDRLRRRYLRRSLRLRFSDATTLP